MFWWRMDLLKWVVCRVSMIFRTSINKFIEKEVFI